MYNWVHFDQWSYNIWVEKLFIPYNKRVQNKWTAWAQYIMLLVIEPQSPEIWTRLCLTNIYKYSAFTKFASTLLIAFLKLLFKLWSSPDWIIGMHFSIALLYHSWGSSNWCSKCSSAAGICRQEIRLCLAYTQRSTLAIFNYLTKDWLQNYCTCFQRSK